MQRLLISAVAIGALAASSQAQCFEQNFGVLAPLTGATAGFGDDVAFDEQPLGFPITFGANGPKHLNVKLTRAKLESLVGELVSRSLEPLKVALTDSGLSASEIDDVILVGGQTRMPLVQQTVADFFSKEPRKGFTSLRGSLEKKSATVCWTSGIRV